MIMTRDAQIPVLKPKSLIGKAWWTLTHRPFSFFPSLRGYFFFRTTRMLQRFVFNDSSQVTLGNNVRLQRLSCLHAERPGATISVGAHSIIYENARIAAYGNATIQLGECSVLGDIKISSRFSIKIGNRFISSWNVFIQDFDPHPPLALERRKQLEAICAGFKPSYEKSPFNPVHAWAFPGEGIEIGDDVWVGANCTILKGAQIGSGSIVATGAVVLAGIYPAHSLIAGNPAKVVKSLA
jgi:acetyltransferase-like isoleucine patch superfamily enzyme